MEATAGPAPWASHKRITKKAAEKAGYTWSMSSAWHPKAPQDWSRVPAKPEWRETTWKGKKVKYLHNDYQNHVGHQADKDYSLEQDVVNAWVEETLAKPSVISFEGCGQIKKIRYSTMRNLMEVSFNQNPNGSGGATCVFFHVPKQVVAVLKEAADSKRISHTDKYGVPRHALGTLFWDYVRIRGQNKGAKYPFSYSEIGDTTEVPKSMIQDMVTNGELEKGIYWKPIKTMMDSADAILDENEDNIFLSDYNFKNILSGINKKVAASLKSSNIFDKRKAVKEEIEKNLEEIEQSIGLSWTRSDWDKYKLAKKVSPENALHFALSKMVFALDNDMKGIESPEKYHLTPKLKDEYYSVVKKYGIGNAGYFNKRGYKKLLENTKMSDEEFREKIGYKLGEDLKEWVKNDPYYGAILHEVAKHENEKNTNDVNNLDAPEVTAFKLFKDLTSNIKPRAVMDAAEEKAKTASDTIRKEKMVDVEEYKYNRVTNLLDDLTKFANDVKYGRKKATDIGDLEWRLDHTSKLRPAYKIHHENESRDTQKARAYWEKFKAQELKDPNSELSKQMLWVNRMQNMIDTNNLRGKETHFRSKEDHLNLQAATIKDRIARNSKHPMIPKILEAASKKGDKELKDVVDWMQKVKEEGPSDRSRATYKRWQKDK